MNREVARKRPAHVINAQPITFKGYAPLPRREVMECGAYEKEALVKTVHAMAKRGEIGPRPMIWQTPHGWAVEVTRLKNAPRVPVWVWKWCLALGLVLILLAAIAYVLILVLPMVTAMLPALIIGLALFLILGGGSVTVIQKVTVRR